MQVSDRIVDALFLLIRAGLWNKSIEVNKVFPLSVQEWKDLYKLSYAHTIQGVVFDGITLLPEGLQAPKDIYIRWMVTTEKIALQNRKMNSVIAQQYVLFNQENIRPVLLKGQYLASYYINPLRRVCGDVDWWFSNSTEFIAANTCMEQIGIQLDYPTSITANYTFQGVEMDHHQQMIDVYNPFVQKSIERFIRKELEQTQSLQIDSVAVSTPSPLLGLVQVNMHILKHLLSFGIGLRQLCDAAVLYKGLSKSYNHNDLLSLYKKIGVRKWIQMLHDILCKNLGVEAEYLPGYNAIVPYKSAWMLQDILQSGNFGFHDARFSEAEKGGGRVAVRSRVTKHMWQYLPYAPMEALSFPIAHYLDRFGKK